MRRPLLVSVSVLALSMSSTLLGQAASARDVFWSASDLVSVAPNPGAKRTAHAVTHRPATVRTASSAPAHIEPQLIAQNGYGERPHFLQTSLATQQIGLRYSLLLRGGDGEYHEVSPDTVFHAGDHLQLSLMSNEPGYLYVITQGSTGSWSPIFPGADAAADANRIEAGQVYQIPGEGKAFQFDTNPGSEKLFVVLTRERIADLDSAIQRLKSPAAPASNPTPQPAGPGEVLEASNRIPDDLVQKLASRDLTLVSEQKVDQQASANKSGEKAVYVVARQDSSNSHEVVAKITLNHR